MASNYVHKSLLKHVANERDDARKELDTLQRQCDGLVQQLERWMSKVAEITEQCEAFSFTAPPEKSPYPDAESATRAMLWPFAPIERWAECGEEGMKPDSWGFWVGHDSHKFFLEIERAKAREVEWYLAQALCVVEQLCDHVTHESNGVTIWDIPQPLFDWIGHIWNPESRVP